MFDRVLDQINRPLNQTTQQINRPILSLRQTNQTKSLMKVIPMMVGPTEAQTSTNSLVWTINYKDFYQLKEKSVIFVQKSEYFEST